MNPKSILVAAAMAMTVLFGGCREDDGPETATATLYDIVEFVNEDKGRTNFALYLPDAESPVNLLVNGTFLDLTEIAEGESLLLAYQPQSGKPYVSGVIKPIGYSYINNEMLLKGKPEDLADWADEPVYLMSLWRAGDKVVVRVMLPYDTEPRTFGLVVDETTLDSGCPVAYLYHKRGSAEPTFQRQYYAAFNLVNLWKREGCEAIDIRVANTNVETDNRFIINNPRVTTE